MASGRAVKWSVAGCLLAALGGSFAPSARAAGDAGVPAAQAIAWKAATQSPRAQAADAKEAPLLSLCGAPDAALHEVAARSARRQLDRSSPIGADELAYNLRASGDPHVWPRAWSIAGQALDEEDVTRRVKAWIAPWNTLGVRRCGVGRAAGPDGTTVIAAVAVDALADVAPLPTTARVGQWVTLDGTMLVPATDAQVVLLGPRGAPKTVVASLSGGKVRSSFSVDQPGAWLVQVLATVATGPRPVLEAMIFAGAAPPAQFVAQAAPGEAAASGVKDDDDAMVAMINAARASEQLAPLARDRALDKLARAHSEAMVKARMVGHDVGGGDPTARIRAAGIKAHIAGENVASAGSLENAHRVLWASPSHRGNLLLDKFTHVGVAVVRAADGMVWVTEMFSG
jgi:uncharacterized protein YkwD